MRRRRSATAAPAAALLLALLCGGVGCTPLGGTTPPSRFYVLHPLEAPADRTGGPRLGIGPIRIAEYLDRPQMVTRPDPYRLRLAEFDRWGEPLAESITRALIGNLGPLLGTAHVERPPFRNVRAIDLELDLDVRRFDGPDAGPVDLVAHWRLRRGREVVAERVTRLSEPLEGSGYAAQAAAMSRAIQRLSREIAAAVPSAASDDQERGTAAASDDQERGTAAASLQEAPSSNVPIRVPRRSGISGASASSRSVPGVATSTSVDPNSKRPHSSPLL